MRGIDLEPLLHRAMDVQRVLRAARRCVTVSRRVATGRMAARGFMVFAAEVGYGCVWIAGRFDKESNCLIDERRWAFSLFVASYSGLYGIVVVNECQ